MGVLHAEAGQQHFGIAVRHVVAISIGIEQQIRHLQHVHAAVAEGQSRGQVQARRQNPCPFRTAVAVGVLENRDPIGAPRPARRRLGHAVVLGPRVAIHLHPLQPGGIRILQILDDPQPARIVELDGHRLPHQRLGGHELDGQPRGTLMCAAASSGENPWPRAAAGAIAHAKAPDSTNSGHRGGDRFCDKRSVAMTTSKLIAATAGVNGLAPTPLGLVMNGVASESRSGMPGLAGRRLRRHMIGG